MKHLKQFESFEEDYQIGDYVLLDVEELVKEWDLLTDDDYSGRIFNKIEMGNSIVNCYYEVKFPDGDFLQVRKEQIKRYLTPEEIEDYQTRKNAIKYNL